MWNTITDYVSNPKFLKKFHGWMTILWMTLLIPSLIWWKESVPWVVTMSVWANIAGHWSSWQASRVEVKEDKREG